MIVSTTNCLHLAKKVAKKKGEGLLKYDKKKFADGEYYYRLRYTNKPRSVALMGNIEASPESLFELLALAQALVDNKIIIKSLVIPYLGYARQDRLNKSGEAVLSKMIINSLNSIKTKKKIFISLHSDAVRKMLRGYTELKPLANMVDIENYDIIVAPDKGAAQRARSIADGKKVIVMPKSRPSADKVRRAKKKYNVKGKSILIVDDMIDTGGTIVSAAEILKGQGAGNIDFVAVHPVLSSPSRKWLNTKAVNRIILSDSLHHYKSKKFKTISLASAIVRELGRS